MEPTASDVLSKKEPYKFLVADPSGDARVTLANVLSGLGPQHIVHADNAQEFERLFKEGPYDLVMCPAILGHRSGLQVLARARSGGSRASFIVYTSIQGAWLRVFVSDVKNTVLSTRVISLEGLAQLASGLLEMGRA